MSYSYVHKICTDGPSKNIIWQIYRKEHKSDFQTTKEFYLVSFSQIDFRLAAKSEIWKWFVAYCLKYDWVNSVG